MTRVEAERLASDKQKIKDGWSYWACHGSFDHWSVRRTRGSLNEEVAR